MERALLQFRRLPAPVAPDQKDLKPLKLEQLLARPIQQEFHDKICYYQGIL
jgi:hypothetical protein